MAEIIIVTELKWTATMSRSGWWVDECGEIGLTGG